MVVFCLPRTLSVGDSRSAATPLLDEFVACSDWRGSGSLRLTACGVVWSDARNGEDDIYGAASRPAREGVASGEPQPSTPLKIS